MEIPSEAWGVIGAAAGGAIGFITARFSAKDAHAIEDLRIAAASAERDQLVSEQLAQQVRDRDRARRRSLRASVESIVAYQDSRIAVAIDRVEDSETVSPTMSFNNLTIKYELRTSHPELFNALAAYGREMDAFQATAIEGWHCPDGSPQRDAVFAAGKTAHAAKRRVFAAMDVARLPEDDWDWD